MPAVFAGAHFAAGGAVLPALGLVLSFCRLTYRNAIGGTANKNSE
jgi:hypothetical protein